MTKTELMIIGSRQRLNTQCDEVDIRIDDEIIKRVDRTKSLGLTIDDRLSWSNHVDEICHFISANTSLEIYNALILPHFDYCSPAGTA